MKKLSVCLFILAVTLVFASAASGLYPNIYELYLSWEHDGYPDYVAGVYSTDGTADHLTVQLVDDADGAFEAEIRQQLEDDSYLTVEPGSYCYQRLLEINDEIVQTYMAQAGSVVSCGVGWDADGGFGPSGMESRVVVTVLEQDLETYRQLFAETYGDAVIVRQGAAAYDLLQETGADKERPPIADAAPLDAKPDAAPEPSAPSNTDSPVPAPMPTATSGNTIIAIVILVALAGGSALYGIVTRKNLQ